MLSTIQFCKVITLDVWCGLNIRTNFKSDKYSDGHTLFTQIKYSIVIFEMFTRLQHTFWKSIRSIWFSTILFYFPILFQVCGSFFILFEFIFNISCQSLLSWEMECDRFCPFPNGIHLNKWKWRRRKKTPFRRKFIFKMAHTCMRIYLMSKWNWKIREYLKWRRIKYLFSTIDANCA